MFGYLRLDPHASKKLFAYWKSNYCYLCKSIENRFGEKSRFALSYDITFLGVLMKESAFFSNVQRIHCFGNRKRFDDPQFLALAEIDLMLAYEMILDKKYDDHAAWSYPLEASFRRQKEAVKRSNPSLHDEIEGFYEDFRKLEQEQSDAKTLADSFGNFMQGLGETYLGITGERLLVLGSVARWIYLIDALDDLDKDIRKGQFNPFKPMAGSAKEFLTKRQDYWNELYLGIFPEVKLTDNDLSTFVISRVYFHSIPIKTAEVIKRILT